MSKPDSIAVHLELQRMALEGRIAEDKRQAEIEDARAVILGNPSRFAGTDASPNYDSFIRHIHQPAKAGFQSAPTFNPPFPTNRKGR